MTLVTTTSTSATALDIIKRSMRLLGVYSIGEDPTADESQDALAALNSLLDSLANTGSVFVKTMDAIALAAGVSSLTVGPSGDVATGRPVKVLPESYFVINNVTYPLALLTTQQYSDIGLKAISGLSYGMWVKPDMPDITLTFWPVPAQATTLNLWSNKQLTGTLSLTSSLSLPPGYVRMLSYLLAEDIGPEFDVVPSPEVLKQAAQARRVLKRTNVEIPELRVPVSLSSVAFRDIREF